MGYNTDFEGSFKIDPPLTPEQTAYLSKFAETRRIKRNAELTALRPDPLREAVGLPVGEEGGYFVGSQAPAGQEYGSYSRFSPVCIDVLNHDSAPKGQPSLWCHWIPSEDGTKLKWDEGEKFYDYVEWIRYIAAHFLGPWGRRLSGEVLWQGEDDDDCGKIVAEPWTHLESIYSSIRVFRGTKTITYEEV